MVFEIIVVLALYWIARQNNVLKHRFAERVAVAYRKAHREGHNAGYKAGYAYGYQKGHGAAFDEYAVKAIEMGGF